MVSICIFIRVVSDVHVYIVLFLSVLNMFFNLFHCVSGMSGFSVCFIFWSSFELFLSYGAYSAGWWVCVIYLVVKQSSWCEWYCEWFSKDVRRRGGRRTCNRDLFGTSLSRRPRNLGRSYTANLYDKTDAYTNLTNLSWSNGLYDVRVHAGKVRTSSNNEGGLSFIRVRFRAVLIAYDCSFWRQL